MSEEILNGLRRAAGQMDRQGGAPRFGFIVSYNPNNYTARVVLQPDDILTGWLPIRAVIGANGWGVVAGPVPGMQATLEPHDGDPGNLIVTGFTFASQATPAVLPPPVPSGEIWLVHQSGAFAKLTSQGQVLLQDKAGSTVSMNGDGTATVSVQTLTVNAEDSIQMTAGSAIELTATGILLNGAISSSAVGGGAGTFDINGTATATVDFVSNGKSGHGHEHESTTPGTPTSPPI